MKTKQEGRVLAEQSSDSGQQKLTELPADREAAG